MARRYQIYDVFSDRALAGNPLAVVLEAEGLDTRAMQAIAREFNLSETVFVTLPDNPGHAAKLRIFTPVSELPFAGHPTVGTAVALASERFRGAAPGEQDAVIVLEENIGPVRCGVTVDGAAGFAEFDSPRLPKALGQAPERDLIAGALGINVSEIGFENHAPSVWTAGVPFHFVPVRDRSVLAEAAPMRAEWTAAFGDDGAYVYTRDAEGHDHAFRARMFAPLHGIEEDPATGSAAAAFAGPIRHYDDLPEGSHVCLVEQGYEMGRPSLIRVELAVSGGSISAVRIGGRALRVAQGVLEL
ncbi:PhzF family phenazine biosynthesis protein [Propylenella binzhouense]|uniref:PhzF family phenazine biosynthesis protein n=1 Tax=Propylenella binzhouense TaxID=2555902 RepID=A0A964WV53_9HYPH|nr:PhzF family phenazine biosynthesis protein [Propylenella binzhouense]MYZ49699.1 PhzF family phenazine biosynthesis protein [Propylenella binzhouense]